MVRISASLATVIVASSIPIASSFGPPLPQQTFVLGRTTSRYDSNKATRTTALEAAPTMVIYWTIKTAFDTLRYAAGQTDEVKGTGVFSGFQLKRETKEDKDEGGPTTEEADAKNVSNQTEDRK